MERQSHKRVGIWIRVSTEDQVRGESPEHHEKRARLYAEAKGWDVIEVYRLDALSGKTVKDFPETKRMLRDIESGHITGLIFSKLARLARNTRELLDFSDYFREHGADLVSLAESIDTSSPAGRLFYTMVAAMAQWEREEIAERVAASVPIRAKLGKSLGGQPPFGYAWSDGRLAPNPDEAPVRKLLYELFQEHRRLKTVARLLNERGYRTRNGSPFSDTTVRRLIEDPTAKGLRRANYTQSQDSGRAWKRKPETEWVLHPVEAVVSTELWEECNSVLAGRKGSRPSRPTIEVRHLFAGLTFCECGTKMYVVSNSPKYVCQACRNKIPIDDLDAIFHEQLKVFSFAPDEIERHLSAYAETVKDKEAQLALLERERHRLGVEVEKLYTLYQADAIDERGFGERHRPLRARLKELDDSLPALQADLDFLKISELSQGEIMESARDLYVAWPTLPQVEKRQIVETITERIVVSKDGVEISLLYAPSLPPSPSGTPPAPTSNSPQGSPSPGTHGKGATRAHGRVALLPFTRVDLRTSRVKPPLTVGEHLRHVRLSRQQRQIDVAQALGVTPSTVVHWERGSTVPTPKDGPRIVAYLGYLPLRQGTLEEKLYALRFLRGLTQTEASSLAQVGEDAWREAEGGRRLSERTRLKIERAVAELLAQALGPPSQVE